MAASKAKKARTDSPYKKGGVRTAAKAREATASEDRRSGRTASSYDVGQGMLKTSITHIDEHRHRTGSIDAPVKRQGVGTSSRGAAAVVTDNGGRGRAASIPNSRKGGAGEKAALPRLKRYYDLYLLIVVLMIFCLGLLMVYSSSQYTALMNGRSHDYYFKRQFYIGLGGVGIMLFCSIFSGSVIKLAKKLSFVYLVVTTLMLVATLLMGRSSHGSSRWLSLFGVSLQPTEFAKIGIILYIASVVSKYGFSIGRFNRRNAIILIIAIVPSMLVASENLSSGIIMVGVAFSMYFVACKNWKLFIVIGVTALFVLLATKPLIRYIVESRNITNIDDMQYQLKRIFAWACPEIFPDNAYQTLQGLYAIGSGGLTGQGLGESIQKYGALPEASNDMIFAVICEELGFIGASAIVLIYIFIILRLVDIARYAKDLFSSMVCVGVVAHISIQVILNIAVVTGTIPNTGVTLPFISYGGSALLCTMAEIGLALAVSHEVYSEA